MPIPKVIMHNSVSLDGSITGFDVNMELHYQIAGRYEADAHLIGSHTVTAGIDMYGGEIPSENETDFVRPARDTSLPYWVIPDTKGITKGLLHTCRSFEFCRDVIVFISERTGEDYIQYLKERNYQHVVCGEEHVDYKRAFEVLNLKFDVKTILVDSGPTLNGILLEKGLIDEISLLVSPILVGETSNNLFSRLNIENRNIELELSGCEELDRNWLLLLYKVQHRKI